MGACPSCKSLSPVDESFEFLIVGGGNAAGYVCRELVAQGVGPGKIGIITNEPVPPYERPALTKAYLHPPDAKVRARLPGFHTCVGTGGERQAPEWYDQKGIRLLSGTAEGVDLAARAVLVGRSRYGYQRLLLATGSRALRLTGLPGADLGGIHYLRTEADAAGLVSALESLGPRARAVVVGGGYIGLECAAALAGWRIPVTLVLPGDRVMARLLNPELAKWLEEEYTARGVHIVRGTSVTELTGEAGVVTGARLKTGELLQCNLVVAGVGGAPNVEWCQGLTMAKGGFAVDGHMRTSDPSVFAVGDVCAFPSQSGELSRCEHVDHARRSAAQAVKSALGLNPEPYNYLPYFYSRVFEYSDAPVVFNFFGEPSGECRVVRRGPKSLGALWDRDGRVVGCMLMGSPGPTAEDAAKLRELASLRPPAGHPQAVFASLGL